MTILSKIAYVAVLAILLLGSVPMAQAQSYQPIGSVVDAAGGIISVAEHKGFLYTLHTSGELKVFDIQELKNATSFYSPDTAIRTFTFSWARGMVKWGETLFLYGDFQFAPIDLSIPADPNIGTPLSLSGLTINATVDQDILALAGTAGIILYSVSDPMTPTFLGVALAGVTGADFHAAHIDGTRLYGAEYFDIGGGQQSQGSSVPGELVVFDIADPLEIFEIGRLTRPDLPLQITTMQGFVIECSETQVSVLDAFDPLDITVKDSVTSPARACLFTEPDRIITQENVYDLIDGALFEHTAYPPITEIPGPTPYGSFGTPDFSFMVQHPQVTILEARGAALALAPTSLDFGDVKAGKSDNQTIAFTNSGVEPLNIGTVFLTGADASYFALDANLNGSVVSEGNTIALPVSFFPDTVRTYSASIIVQSDAAGGEHTIPISGTGVAPAAMFNLNPIVFPTAAAGGESIGQVILTNTGDAPLEINAINILSVAGGPGPEEFSFIGGDDPGVVDPGLTRNIDMRFNPTAAGFYQAVLEVDTDDPVGLHHISMEATAEAPNLVTDLQSLDFPDTRLQAESVLSLQITNEGDGDLSISQFSLTGPQTEMFGFESGMDPVTIAPSGTHVLEVRFKPTLLGQHNANVQIESDDADSPHVIPLTGFGTGPIAIMTPASHDFAATPLGVLRQLAFSLSNTGTAPLDVSSIEIQDPAAAKAGNDMFSIASGGEPIILAPEESVSIVVGFQPTENGFQEAELVVVSDDPASPLRVSLTGIGTEALLVSSPANVVYPDTPVGGIKDTTITLSNTGNQNLSISSVTLVGASPQMFSIVSGGDAGTIGPGASRPLVLRFAPSSGGLHQASLQIESNASGSPTMVPVEGTGAQPNFAAETDTLFFAPASIGGTVDATVTIQNDGNADMGIEVILIVGADGHPFDPKNFAITSGGEGGVLKPGETRIIGLQYTPQNAGVHVAALEVFDSAPGSPHRIILSGSAAQPGITVTPLAIGFGNVVPGVVETAIVQIESTGSEDLEISEIILEGEQAGFFSIDTGGPATLAPGNMLQVEAQFAPTAAGSYQASMRITSNAPDSPHVVSLMGVSQQEGGFTVTPNPVIFPASLIDVSVQAVVTIQNDGNAALTLAGLVLGGTDPEVFAVLTTDLPGLLNPGERVAVTLAFTPNRIGQHDAVLQIQGPQPLDIPLQGAGVSGTLSLSPGSVTFPDTAVDSTDTAFVTLTNDGTAPVDIQSLTIVGADAASFGFAVTEDPGLLAAGASRSIGLTFTPQHAGQNQAFLSIEAPLPESPLQLPMLGQGLVSIGTFGQDSLVFAGVGLGESIELPISLRNVGQATLIPTAISITGIDAEAFSILGTNNLDPIAPGAARPMTVQFTPSHLGRHLASVEIISNDPNGPLNLVLDGWGQLTLINTVAAVPMANKDLPIEVLKPPLYDATERDIFFRRGGEVEYQSMPLTDLGPNFVGSIPAGYVTERGVDYYVRLSDGNSVVTIPPVTPALNPMRIRVQVPPQAIPFQLAPESHRMISIPLELDDATFSEVFEDDFGSYDQRQWRLHRWMGESQTYQEYPDLSGGAIAPGMAFWLITKENPSFDVDSSLSVEGSGHQVTLQPGWNQIGSPYSYPIGWQNVSATVDSLSGMYEAPVYYDGFDYIYNTTVLMPWEGYFVFNRSTVPITLLMRPIEFGEAETANQVTANNATAAEAIYAVQMTAWQEDHRLIDKQNRVGFLDDALPGRDAYDMQEAPPYEDHVRLSVLGAAERRLATDYKPLTGEGQHWDFQVSAVIKQDIFKTKKRVEVRLAENGQMPAGFNRYVLDLDRGVPVPIQDGRFEITLEPDEPARTLRLVIGTESYAMQHSEDIPLEALEDGLEQNYPNPFNPQTRIAFQLSEPGVAVLEVYDMLGRRIVQLMNQEMQAGRHAVTWDGRDAAGKPVASGVYLYQLRAGQFSQSKKMVLLQ